MAGHILTQALSLGFVQHLGEERAHLRKGSEREILELADGWIIRTQIANTPGSHCHRLRCCIGPHQETLDTSTR